MICDIADVLTNLERFLLDQLGALQRLWAQLFKLHEFGVGKHHPDPVIQVVQPFPYFVFIHRHINLTQL